MLFLSFSSSQILFCRLKNILFIKVIPIEYEQLAQPVLGLKVKMKFKNLSRDGSQEYISLTYVCSSKVSKNSLFAFRFYLQGTFIVGQDSTSARSSLYKRPRFVPYCQVLKTCLEDVVKRIITKGTRERNARIPNAIVENCYHILEAIIMLGTAGEGLQQKTQQYSKRSLNFVLNKIPNFWVVSQQIYIPFNYLLLVHSRIKSIFGGSSDA